MSLEKVLAALLLVGSDLPAFRALFEQVIDLFSDADQETLKTSYEAALSEAAKAHAAAQTLED